MNRMKSESIILKQIPYSESSIIIEAFTQKSGIIRLLTKGARKRKKSMLPLQSLAISNIRYKEKEEGLGLLNDYNLVFYPERLPSNWEDWNRMNAFILFLKKTIPYGVEQNDLYMVLKYSIIKANSGYTEQMFFWSLLHALKLLGYPFWDKNFKLEIRKILDEEKGYTISEYFKKKIFTFIYDNLNISMEQFLL